MHWYLHYKVPHHVAEQCKWPENRRPVDGLNLQSPPCRMYSTAQSMNYELNTCTELIRALQEMSQIMRHSSANTGNGIKPCSVQALFPHKRIRHCAERNSCTVARILLARASQLQLPEGPHDPLRTRLRAASVYTYIKKWAGGLNSLECRYFQTISYAKITAD